MRAHTRNRIAALHAEIARLVEMEKAYMRKQNPNQNSMHRHITETQIEVEAWPPHLHARCQLQGPTKQNAPKA